jgi:hypothetical protein
MADELKILDLKTTTLFRNGQGRLCVRIDNQIVCEDIKPVMAFPLTSPIKCIMLQSKTGDEIGCIDDSAMLDAESLKLLEDEIRITTMGTVIIRIEGVTSSHGVTTWHLATDRGTRTIHVKDRSDIRWLDGGKVVITDINGMKYTVTSISALDEKSRILLEEES